MAASKKTTTRRKPLRAKSNGTGRTRRNYSVDERRDFVRRFRVENEQTGITQGDFATANEIGLSSLVRWLAEFPNEKPAVPANGHRVVPPARTSTVSSHTTLEAEHDDGEGEEPDEMAELDEQDPDVHTSDLQAGGSFPPKGDDVAGVTALMLPAPKTPEEELQEKEDRIVQLEDELYDTKNKLAAMERLVQAATGVRQLGA